MQKLEERVKPRGIGIPGLTAELIERTEKKAIYLRSDGIYEVFKILIHPEETLPSGKTYPEREVYPGNEDFGVTAWCFNNKENALKRYNELK